MPECAIPVCVDVLGAQAMSEVYLREVGCSSICATANVELRDNGIRYRLGTHKTMAAAPEETLNA